MPLPTREPPISDFLRRLLARIFARSENFVAGRYWHLEVLFLSVLFSILFSAGVDDRLWEVNNNHYYPAYFQKIEHPLLNVAKIYQPWTHDAKLNFRLTVPVLLHLVHWPVEQRWILPVLTAAAICAIIFLSCLFAAAVTHDRVCGLYVALGVGCTYIGSFGFTMYYDAIAIAQLALAMLPQIPWLLRGCLVFTAAFTDERALLASPMLLVQTLCSVAPSTPFSKRLAHPQFLAVIGGMAGYCIVRLLLMKYAGLTAPTAGTGVGNLLANVPYYHLGTWLALKGGWLLVVLAAISLWQRRQFTILAAFVLTAGLSLGGGFCVEDVVRSTAYIFPALFVALLIVSQNETTYALRVYCLIAFVLSAITGNYNIWRSEISWFQPIAIKILHHGMEWFLK